MRLAQERFVSSTLLGVACARWIASRPSWRPQKRFASGTLPVVTLFCGLPGFAGTVSGAGGRDDFGDGAQLCL
jgi:hypothetical protein